ncbi:Clp protease N-terminal domain-containing protein [Micromonospora sp. NPDC048839]|uniref:Clp protease N-terminal domain-containing protein n=1 Tax=Micromonospora sp. NPDC048839 TaxID=3155641 RepID=UPI0033E85C77
MSQLVGGGLHSVLRRAAREAARLKKLSVGADDLLFGLVGRYPQLRAAIPVESEPQSRTTYDVPDQPELPLTLTVELTRAMRETYWNCFGWPGPARVRLAETLGWEPEARAVLGVAAHLAVLRRASSVGSGHLLEALLDEPGNSAHRYIVWHRLVPGRLDDVTARLWPRGDREAPRSGLADPLRQIGVLVGGGQQPSRGGRLASRLIASGSRLLAQTTPTLGGLELEAVAETVRLGHDRTSPAHLMAAVLVLEEEMRAGVLRPAGASALANEILLGHFGPTRQEAGLVLAETSFDGEFVGSRPRRAWRTDPTNPPWTVAADRIAERAREVSTLGARLPAGSAHLVYAALTDPDEDARRLLAGLGVDPNVVCDLAARRLGLA